jgi:hypothetical protein
MSSSPFSLILVKYEAPSKLDEAMKATFKYVK